MPVSRLRGLMLPLAAVMAFSGGVPAAAVGHAARAVQPTAAGLKPAASSAVTGSPGVLDGVSATSATNAWAAGYYANSQGVERTLMLHWNGSTWSKIATPNPGGLNGDDLQSVSASSATSAWAAGSYATSTGSRTLILRWNGSSWSKVASPNPGPARWDVLQSVSAVSATSAWAVGSYCASGCGGAGVQKTLILHWNGSSWSKVASPDPSAAFNSLDGVDAISATNAWAVGNYCASSCGAGPAEVDHTLALHWNGSTWSQVATPSPGPGHFVSLGSVSAVSATSAWAVGSYCASGCGGTGAQKTLILHWNGSSWSKMTTPNPSTVFNVLSSVDATSATSAWAVGYYCASSCTGGPEGNDDTMILHWNGSSWARVASPSPYAKGINALFAVGAPAKPTTSAWAVGLHCPSIKCPSPSVLMLRWNGTAWAKS